MVLTTFGVGTAVTPTIIKTTTSHYLNREPRRQRPTAHISYDQGLNMIRAFLEYASHHTVEELQAFTSQWVPNPRWVKVDEVVIPEANLSRAAEAIQEQLGHRGVDKVGGKTWWQWRRENTKLKAEWIEMRGDYQQRKKMGDPGKRVMLYVHGGAFFFGSVDEHRYQMQRHARKLNARVFAPRYRLAPQFPFPCGLHDCLAAYLFLLETQDPSTIVLAGDSAGGGMVLSMLIILRDQGIPLPAGAILISPWVDLTHSFPSVTAEDNEYDYIPAHGFLQRPSYSWPPPNSEDMEQMARNAVEQVVGESLPRKSTQQERQDANDAAVLGFEVHDAKRLSPDSAEGKPPKGTPGGEAISGSRAPQTIGLSITMDGHLVEIKDQIQMYTTNDLIAHPLVSPVMQPSLGGLPPLLIVTGGGEMLRDEQIYVAHKAANPTQYPPSEKFLQEHPDASDIVSKWPPTDVQLQVWDDLCHVAPTLSFTRPAKYMYRSIAQFGAWALARAQKTEIEIMDDDDISIISNETSSDGSTMGPKIKGPLHSGATAPNGVKHSETTSRKQIGKAGEPLPAFRSHMIRQRVDRHGNIFPLSNPSNLPALQMDRNEIGVIKPGPVRKWLNAKKEWDTKFAKDKRRVQKKRVKEMVKGFQGFGDDEVPPPSALAGRRGVAHTGGEGKRKRSWAMSLWSLWGSSHDEKAIHREEKADKSPVTVAVTGATDGANGEDRPTTNGAESKHEAAPNHPPNSPQDKSRSRSRRRRVTDLGQTDGADENTTAAELAALRKTHHERTKEKAPGSQSAQSDDDTENLTLHPTETQYYDVSPPAHNDEISPLASPGLLSPNMLPLPPPSPMSEVADISGFEGRRSTPNRPTSGGVAFPFKLRSAGIEEEGRNASTITLMSGAGPFTPGLQEDERARGRDGEVWAIAGGAVAGAAAVVVGGGAAKEKAEKEKGEAQAKPETEDAGMARGIDAEGGGDKQKPEEKRNTMIPTEPEWMIVMNGGIVPKNKRATIVSDTPVSNSSHVASTSKETIAPHVLGSTTEPTTIVSSKEDEKEVPTPPVHGTAHETPAHPTAFPESDRRSIEPSTPKKQHPSSLPRRELSERISPFKQNPPTPRMSTHDDISQAIPSSSSSNGAAGKISAVASGTAAAIAGAEIAAKSVAHVESKKEAAQPPEQPAVLNTTVPDTVPHAPEWMIVMNGGTVAHSHQPQDQTPASTVEAAPAAKLVEASSVNLAETSMAAPKEAPKETTMTAPPAAEPKEVPAPIATSKEQPEWKVVMEGGVVGHDGHQNTSSAVPPEIGVQSQRPLSEIPIRARKAEEILPQTNSSALSEEQKVHAPASTSTPATAAPQTPNSYSNSTSTPPTTQTPTQPSAPPHKEIPEWMVVMNGGVLDHKRHSNFSSRPTSVLKNGEPQGHAPVPSAAMAGGPAGSATTSAGTSNLPTTAIIPTIAVEKPSGANSPVAAFAPESTSKSTTPAPVSVNTTNTTNQSTDAAQPTQEEAVAAEESQRTPTLTRTTAKDHDTGKNGFFASTPNANSEADPRPILERFATEDSFASSVGDEIDGQGRRPRIERFETAQEEF
ncbi:hypothetical protein MMC25_005941 [Agyrium rufum]|nr:hypothetical protein [Agyrium rufum]